MNIPRIVNELKAGNLVIAPTDTVYGILADATNPAAVEKVYQAKKRSRSKPLLLIVSDKKMLLDYVDELSSVEENLIDSYMPGKLTLLLKKNQKVLSGVTNNEYVGIRIPDNTDLRTIIEQIGRPLVSTSANLSDNIVATNPELLEPELLAHVAYVENAGTILSEPSSLVKIVDGEVVVLRDGEVARQIADLSK